jgi:phage N-6-adenine-methyltransferase
MHDHDRRIIHSSDEANWRTPPALFAALHREFDFTLDAAADAANHLCPTWLGPGSSIAEDCLSTRWYGRVFINPPYSRKQKIDIAPFLCQCAAQAQAGNAEVVVGVVPFAPQTKWYRNFVWGHAVHINPAMEERRLPHRISFLRPDGSKAGNAGVNHAIVVWRPNPGYLGLWTPTVRYWDYRER